MKFELGSLLVSASAIWAAVKLFYNKYEPKVRPLIEVAEAEYKERIKDGVLDLPDRKAIVMAMIAKAEANGEIKLNFISRWLISKVIDKIAQKLPPIIIPVNNELTP
jgi:3-methyladenine DNA glycosylase/8-oxoguanine DNA glycosylase